MALCPVCYSEIGMWSDDPIKTPKGLAGSSYIGFTYICSRHINQLQTYWSAKEIEAGVSEAQRTNFILVSGAVRKFHIYQLRVSVEKCLNASGQSKHDYFNYDAEGNDMGTNKTQWTDPLLTNDMWIRAIHIEDLRHPLVIELEWLETWEDAITGVYFNVEGATPTAPGWHDASELIANPITGAMADWEYYGQYRHNHLGTIPAPGGQCWVKGEMKGTDNHYYMYAKAVKEELPSIPTRMQAKSGVYIDANLEFKVELTEDTKLSFDIADFVLNSTTDPAPSLLGGGMMIEIKTVTVTSKPITYYVHSNYSGGSGDLYDHHSIHGGQRGITLSWSEFQNFDRNIWNDYITMWGEAPASGRWINYIRCEAVSDASPDTNSEAGFSIDNIKLYTET